MKFSVPLLVLVALLPLVATCGEKTQAPARPTPGLEDLVPPEDAARAEETARDFADMLSQGRLATAVGLLDSGACPGATSAVQRWNPEVDGRLNILPPGVVVSTINADLVILPTTLRYPPSIVVIFRRDGEQEWMVSGLTFGCAFDPR